jgi:hypothetical protein
MQFQDSLEPIQYTYQSAEPVNFCSPFRRNLRSSLPKICELASPSLAGFYRAASEAARGREIVPQVTCLRSQ